MTLIKSALVLCLNATDTEAAHGGKEGIAISDESVFEILDEVDFEILVAFAKCGMNVTRTAREIHFDRRTVSNRLTNIRLKCGIDPRDFWGLTNLLRIIDEEGGVQIRGLLH